MEYEVVKLGSLSELPDSKESHKRPLSCKFVLLGTDQLTSLVCGPVTQYAYHAALVNQFCIANGISVRWERRPDIAAPVDSGLELHGGGLLLLDFASQKALFSGQSKSYGPFSLPLLNELLTRTRPFPEFQLEIEA